MTAALIRPRGKGCRHGSPRGGSGFEHKRNPDAKAWALWGRPTGHKSKVGQVQGVALLVLCWCQGWAAVDGSGQLQQATHRTSLCRMGEGSQGRESIFKLFLTHIFFNFIIVVVVVVVIVLLKIIFPPDPTKSWRGACCNISAMHAAKFAVVVAAAGSLQPSRSKIELMEKK